MVMVRVMVMVRMRMLEGMVVRVVVQHTKTSMVMVS